MVYKLKNNNRFRLAPNLTYFLMKIHKNTGQLNETQQQPWFSDIGVSSIIHPVIESSIVKNFFIASLIYLMLGLLAQTVAIFDGWLGFNPLAYTAVTATEQMLLVGWLTQLALAFIYRYWFTPLESEPGSSPKAQLPASPATSSRPHTAFSASIIVFVLFNLGLPCVIIGQPGLALLGGPWLGAVAAFGGVLQLLAGLVFVYEVWQRLFKNQ